MLNKLRPYRSKHTEFITGFNYKNKKKAADLILKLTDIKIKKKK